jgi:zinc finger protein
VGLNLGEVEYEVENFGRVLMSVTTCTSCGFRHSDVFSLTTHDPTIMSLKIASPDDLKTRIVRSGTSTITVPELGVSIKPGMNSEGFISNVEGLLTRVEDVLQFVTRSLEGRKKQKANLVLRKIQRAREGKLRITVVLKDPFGNSGIVSRKAKRRRMSTRELNRLKFGEHAVAQRERS